MTTVLPKFVLYVNKSTANIEAMVQNTSLAGSLVTQHVETIPPHVMPKFL